MQFIIRVSSPEGEDRQDDSFNEPDEACQDNFQPVKARELIRHKFNLITLGILVTTWG